MQAESAFHHHIYERLTRWWAQLMVDQYRMQDCMYTLHHNSYTPASHQKLTFSPPSFLVKVVVLQLIHTIAWIW